MLYSIVTQPCESHHGPVSKSGQLHQVLKCVHCLARLQRTHCAGWMKLSFRKPQNYGSLSPSRPWIDADCAGTGCDFFRRVELFDGYNQARSRKICTFPNFRSPSCSKIPDASVPSSSRPMCHLHRIVTMMLEQPHHHRSSLELEQVIWIVGVIISSTGSLLLSHRSPLCPSRDGYHCVWAGQIGSGLSAYTVRTVSLTVVKGPFPSGDIRGK